MGVGGCFQTSVHFRTNSGARPTLALALDKNKMRTTDREIEIMSWNGLIQCILAHLLSAHIQLYLGWNTRVALNFCCQTNWRGKFYLTAPAVLIFPDHLAKLHVDKVISGVDTKGLELHHNRFEKSNLGACQACVNSPISIVLFKSLKWSEVLKLASRFDSREWERKRWLDIHRLAVLT